MELFRCHSGRNSGSPLTACYLSLPFAFSRSWVLALEIAEAVPPFQSAPYALPCGAPFLLSRAAQPHIDARGRCELPPDPVPLLFAPPTAPGSLRREAKTPPPPTRTPRAKWVPFFPLASPPASSPDIHGGLAGPYAPGGRDTRCPLCSSPRSTWLSLAAAAVWVLGPAFPVSSTPGSAPSPPRPQDTSPHRVPFPVAAWSLLSSRGAETGPSGQQAFQTCVSCGSGR